MILPRVANLGRMEFSERTGKLALCVTHQIEPFYFMPMISNYGDAVTMSLINGYGGAVRDLLQAGVAFCEPEKFQKFLQ